MKLVWLFLDQQHSGDYIQDTDFKSTTNIQTETKAFNIS